MAANGLDVRALPVDSDGRLVVDEASTALSAEPPALVHLTSLASHRGVAQPAAAIAEVCRGLGVPLVIDAAQSLGHIDCVVGADAIYSSPRKWMAGPRGVGVLANPARAGAAAAATGLGPAVDRVVAAGERRSQCRCARGVFGRARRTPGGRPGSDPRAAGRMGHLTRTALAHVAGWRVVEPIDSGRRPSRR
jgi:pyridoxal 5-phosphate dependent beta-lyase